MQRIINCSASHPNTVNVDNPLDQSRCKDVQRSCFDQLTKTGILSRACSAGKQDAVRYLVEEARMSLESKDGMGATPISVAAASGEKDIALYLITVGADVEVRHYFLKPSSMHWL